MSVTAIIAAGGTGRRIGADIPKQYLPVLGIPMIIHTLRAFERADMVDRVIVVVPRGEEPRLSADEQRRYELKKVIAVVPGGATRQESVRCGLVAVSDTPSYVAIHDAARCLITPEQIDQTIRSCEGWDGAVLALPVRDTLKRVEKEKILTTEPRESLWAMQTPQVFRFPFIREAHEKARAEDTEVTDDAALAEWVGGRVRVVEGSLRNFKVTRMEDLSLAERLLSTGGT